jgi:hypothetical protein
MGGNQMGGPPHCPGAQCPPPSHGCAVPDGVHGPGGTYRPPGPSAGGVAGAAEPEESDPGGCSGDSGVGSGSLVSLNALLEGAWGSGGVALSTAE